MDADFLEPLLMTVNMDDYESLQYFQRMLRQSGIIDALEEKGIEEGDTVSIFDFQFDFVKSKRFFGQSISFQNKKTKGRLHE